MNVNNSFCYDNLNESRQAQQSPEDCDRHQKEGIISNEGIQKACREEVGSAVCGEDSQRHPWLGRVCAGIDY